METNIIKQACTELGITQKKLAERLGVSESAIRKASSTMTFSPQMLKGIENLIELEKAKRNLEEAEKVRTILSRWVAPSTQENK